jgi:hypothetical protein
MESERVHGHLFEEDRPPADVLLVSPFLVFAVCVNRAAAELERATFVAEWVAPKQRIPVMDVEQLRNFLADRSHRYFLAELLASYTRVASGAMWVESRRGWRRQRFSELDPVRFAALLDVVPESQRPGIYRRLGDLALFLTGVFPDYSASRLFGRFDLQRLLRSSAGREAGGAPPEELGPLGTLEELGERWYRLACSSARAPATSNLRLVASVADRFRQARRVLNFVTERFLFAQRSNWFPLAP